MCGVSARQRLFRITTVCFLFFRAVLQLHAATPPQCHDSRGLVVVRFFSLLLFILLLFMNGCPEDDLKI